MRSPPLGFVLAATLLAGAGAATAARAQASASTDGGTGSVVVRPSTPAPAPAPAPVPNVGAGTRIAQADPLRGGLGPTPPPGSPLASNPTVCRPVHHVVRHVARRHVSRPVYAYAPPPPPPPPVVYAPVLVPRPVVVAYPPPFVVYRRPFIGARVYPYWRPRPVFYRSPWGYD